MLRMSEEIYTLITKIQELPEFKAVNETTGTSIFGISVVTGNSLREGSLTFVTHEVYIYEGFMGERIGGKFHYQEEEGFSYRNKDVDEGVILHKMQMAMQKFMGIPVYGVYQ